MTALCLQSATEVRIAALPPIVSLSLHSPRTEDTQRHKRSAVQDISALTSLGEGIPDGKASWLVGVARTLTTAREALQCRREILEERTRELPNPALRAAWLRDASARVAHRMRLSVRVRGPVPTGACIVAANHLSYLDPLSIGQILPLSAVAKSEITGWPAIGEVLAELGILFVERGNAYSGAVALRRAIRIVRAGVPLLVFPEGTTTRGEDVLPFSRGAFGLARLMRVPVVPATLRYESSEACWVGSASLLPHLLKIHRHEQVRAELTFGPPLEPLAFPDASSLAAATRQCIRSLILR